MSKRGSRVIAFFSELRRRRLFRTLLAYGAVAFVIAEGSDIAFPALGFPPWTVTLVVLLLLAGVPVVLILAWAFDITPEGITRTPALPQVQAVDAGPTVTNDGQPAAAAIATPSSPDPDAIAVLPFENRSGDEDNEYFADGVTEELIDTLTRVPGLKVAARTSSFAFKETRLDAKEIGQRLGVSRLVEGTVRSLSPTLRVSVRLVDAAEGFSDWSETFVRQFDDVFAVQREVALAILERLQTDTDEAASLPGRTTSIDAYKLYLRGRYHWNRRTEADLEKAIGYFEEAIEIDPAYVDAHCGLADTHAILLDYGLRPPAVSLPSATEAAERAVSLDPDLAEARTSRALAHLFAWEWDEAESQFRRALELNPRYSVARQRYALLLAWTGRAERALAEIETALRGDPLNLTLSASTGWILYYARRYEEALDASSDTLALDADFAPALSALGQIQSAMEDFDQAVETHRRAYAASGESASSLSLLAYALARAGERAEAEDARERLETLAQTRYVSPYYLALPPLGSGETEEAMTALERAFEDRAANLVYIGVEPILDPVRSLPAFGRVLAGVGLPAPG